MELITKLDKALAKGEEVLLALMLVGMVLLAALQVVLRNVWHTGIEWADITVQNATVLLGLVGAAVATSEGRHLNIDLLSRALKGRSKTLLKVLIGLFAVYICALLTKGGYKTFSVNYEPWKLLIPEGWTAGQNLKQQFLEGNIPQWLSQLLLPIGFGLIGFHFVLRLVRDVGTLITGEQWEHTEEEGAAGDALLDEMSQEEGAEDPGADEEGAPKEQATAGDAARGQTEGGDR